MTDLCFELGRIPEGGHATKGERSGDWITFTCLTPGCEYMRKLNWKTGETHVVRQSPLPHASMYAPEFLKTLN